MTTRELEAVLAIRRAAANRGSGDAAGVLGEAVHIHTAHLTHAELGHVILGLALIIAEAADILKANGVEAEA